MTKRVLVACEESGIVTEKLRKMGIEAYSCDVLPTSGNHPEWHLRQDVIPLLQEDWDAIIAFPPCTHLAVSGARWFEQKRKDGRQQQGIDLFMEIANAPCKRVAIENPVGIMSTEWRTPDQIVQPFYFGDSFKKTTCLWLKGLPLLVATNVVDEGEFVITKKGSKKPKWYADAFGLPPQERAKVRSRTFDGLASAMAQQWGKVILEGENES